MLTYIEAEFNIASSALLWLVLPWFVFIPAYTFKPAESFYLK
jgi:hypothetical protein